VRKTAWVWVSTIVLAALLLVACGSSNKGKGGGGGYGAGPLTPTTVSTEDANLTAADFHNVNTMTRVGDHFIANVNGHLAQALAVANSATGGVYPVGTILQLVPQEAMVKRRAGFRPATHDWEFFSLDVSKNGTRVLTRGGAEVLNRFGDSCATCHGAADARFDLVCGQTHGCAPLPFGPEIFALLQRTDPRPR
jgi:hypothetical protein